VPSVPLPIPERRGLGKLVLVALLDPAQAQVGFAVGARVAAGDGGIVRALLNCPPGARRERETALAQMRSIGYGIGVDTDPMLLMNRSFRDGMTNAVAEQEPSLVLLGQQHPGPELPEDAGAGETLALSIEEPVALLIGEASRIREVVLVEPPARELLDGNEASRIARELAARVGGKSVVVMQEDARTAFENLGSGQLAVMAGRASALAAADNSPTDAAAVVVIDRSP
jgi:hypothetical protein